METLLNSSPVVKAQQHALPFRVMFEEHFQRRRDDLLKHVVEQFFPAPAVAPESEESQWKALLDALATQEAAYKKLAVVDAELAKPGGDEKKLDECLTNCKAADGPLKALLHRMESEALCLSGGGIRSASFCLGILEGLADFGYKKDAVDGVMHTLDYVSTVSGGGYIGSWLMAWVYRRKKASGNWTTAYQNVVNSLAGYEDGTGGDPEPQPVRHLRSYTSYLAPALGLTLDTFTLAAIVMRNLLANWMMLIPGLIGLIALVRCSGQLMRKTDHWLRLASGNGHTGWGGFEWALVPAIFVLFAVAAVAASMGLPSHAAQRPDKMSGNMPARIFLSAVVLGCWLLTIWLPFSKGNDAGAAFHSNFVVDFFIDHFSWLRDAGPYFTAISLIALAGYCLLSVSIWFTLRRRAKEQTGTKTKPLLPGSLVLMFLAAATASGVTGGLFELLRRTIFPALVRTPPTWLSKAPMDGLFLLFALPLTITVLLASTSLFCALIGVFEMEEDREWWSRGGGWLLGLILFWIVAHAIAFYGAPAWIGLCGLGVGAAGSLVGYSGVTSAGARPMKSAQVGKVGAFLTKHNLVLPVVGGIAVILIAMGAAAAEEYLRPLLPHASAMHGVPRTVVMLLAGAVLTVVLNRVININLFSLGGMYRLRLMRAYLGASNVLRRADAFTNFDPRDTPYEVDLPKSAGAPLHVINTTLNLVGTKNLAWRQRKGESFTFNPVVCGGWRVGYVRTDGYGGSRGVTLATAMAISGAAANPNMGYHSSPLLSLLMTFFNLRLGSWLPNPKDAGDGDGAKEFLKESGPTFALHPLVEEALGQTDDTNHWVELTDGGHFENLGIYEMVMRRCKRIIVVDAGADPDCQFEDLGNAIRKIRIDLGVPIIFGPEMKMEAGMKPGNSYCCVATIYYQYVDGMGTNGTLIYIKASVTGGEPADILQYAKTHPTFPHESTADQFFNESQFESYRHLGFHVISTIKKHRVHDDRSMAGFRTAAQNLWASLPPESTPAKDVAPPATSPPGAV